MASTKQNVSEIIRAATVACDGIGGSSAQAQDADPAAIVPIQTNMILAIAAEHGVEITEAAAAELLQTLTATVRSRQVPINRQAMVGWLPGIDNVANGSTIAPLTEAIGWTANSHFEQMEAKSR